MKSAASVDSYISGFPTETQKKLQKIREIIRKEAPAAGEKISYGIPCFNVNGKYFIYFAGYDKHIAIYPIHKGSTSLDKELKPYFSGTATLRFPLNKPMPWPLILKVVAFKAKEV